MGDLDALRAIYVQQHTAARSADPDVAVRRVHPVLLDADLFVVGTAPGAAQRASGLPFTLPGGPPFELDRAGRQLDEQLAEIGRTVDPGDTTRRLAYCTDLQPAGEPATAGDVEAAAAWLEAELALVAPRAVLCLGKDPACELLERYAGQRVRRLGDAVGRTWTIEVDERELPLLAIHGPGRASDAAREAWAHAGAELRSLLALA